MKRSCERAQGEALAIPTDITDPQETAQMVGTATSAFGRLDVAVNVAGIFRRGALTELDEQDWDDVHTVNLRGILSVGDGVRHRQGWKMQKREYSE